MGVMKVRDLMTSEPKTLFADETMDLARLLMALGAIRHLPVVDRAHHLVGVVSNRDILRASESQLHSGGELDLLRDTDVKVEEIMTRDLLSVTPDTSALEAAETMRKNMVGCLPVVESKRLVGILTETDFVELAATYLASPSG